MSYLIIFSDRDSNDLQRKDFDDLINKFSIKIDNQGMWIPNSVLELQDNDDNGFILPHFANQLCERISTDQYRDRNS